MNRYRVSFWFGLVLILFALVVYLLPIGFDMSAVIVAGLGAVFLFFSVCRSRSGRRIVLIVLLVGCLCFAAAERLVVRGAHSDADAEADYLVVMGAGIRGFEPSQSMQDRLVDALSWLTKHPHAKLIVSGSRAPDELHSEAVVMFKWLVERGADPEHLLIEDEADSTTENIRNALALIARDGGDPTGPVAFVSSEYHMCRIRMLAERMGCQPRCIAAPTSEPAMKINLFIREAFAMWQIWVFGVKA